MEKGSAKVFLIVLFLMALSSVAFGASADWRIDRNLRFHYAFFDPQESSDQNLGEAPASAGFFPLHEPDITNISLRGLIDLEFPVPQKDGAERFRFYLKFYRFPESIDPQVTMHRLLNDFLLYKMSGGEDVYSYVGKRENLWIKKGYIAADSFRFSPTTIFPPLRVPRNENTAVSAQEKFDQAIPFSSLYVKPAEPAPSDLNRDQQAAWSTKGLIKFHRELERLYLVNYTEIQGVAGDKYRYFGRIDYSLGSADTTGALTILRLPRRPMVFANYDSLPMPHDPTHIFLTGLVLVHKTVYSGRNPAAVISGAIPIGSVAFETAYTKVSAHVLEIGSVVVFP
ncbi:MAG: hypothetical protein GYA36_08885 [Veillonellaceae bacterium]|jgi:hypothetical protein|nr:hypothetical protein [Veillonellaceae bacterium]